MPFEEYYRYLIQQTYYHFDIELIYIHLISLKGAYTKSRYLEKLINDYELGVKSCMDDNNAPTEYYFSMKYFSLRTPVTQQGIEYNFGKYQHAIYLLLLDWKKAVESQRLLKAPAHISESEFYRNYGNPIPSLKPKSLFKDDVNFQKYIDLIPSDFVNKHREFIAPVSKTIIVAWYDALKEHGSIVQTQLTSEEVARFVNKLFPGLDIDRRSFSGKKVTKVYEFYKPEFSKNLKTL